MYLRRWEHYCCSPNGTSQGYLYQLGNTCTDTQRQRTVLYKCKRGYLKSSLATRGVGRFRLGGRYMTFI